MAKAKAQKGGKDLLKGIKHYFQSTIKLEGEKVIYVDPFKIPGEPHDADIIFCTHPHFDHMSPGDIKKIMKPETMLVVPKRKAKKFKKFGLAYVIGVKPFEDLKVGGVMLKTVPAYNIGKMFHRKRKNWLGYIITVNDSRYYFAGDTDRIPEMADIETDVAFLPVGGKYTMNAEEAAEAANLIRPKVAVPIHFADIEGVGTRQDARTFVDNLDKEIEGVILKD